MAALALLSLPFPLPPSLGADRIIFCIRAEAGPVLHTEDSISHNQPHCGQEDTANHAGVSVAWPSTILCSSRSLSVLLSCLCWSCYLVSQMEVFNFKSTDLSELLPLLLVPVWTVMTVGQSRSEICGLAFSEEGHLNCVYHDLQKNEAFWELQKSCVCEKSEAC